MNLYQMPNKREREKRLKKLQQQKAPDISEKAIDKLIEAINTEAQQQEEYYLENEDNPVADYCTWGWTEGDLDEIIGRVNDIERDLDCHDDINILVHVNTTNEGLNKLELLKDLFDCCTLECCDIHCRDGELYSMPLSETEVQLSEEVEAQLTRINDEDLHKVCRHVDCYIGQDHLLGLIYINLDYNRWSQIVDKDLLHDKAVELKKTNSDLFIEHHAM